MARIGESADLFKCSFCGKSQKQVQQLIAGPGVYICDECVELCNEIIEERMAESSTGVVADFDLPKPREIYVEDGAEGIVALEIVDADDVRQIVKLRDPVLLPAPGRAR